MLIDHLMIDVYLFFYQLNHFFHSKGGTSHLLILECQH